MLSAHASHLEAVSQNPPLARLVSMLRGLKEEREKTGTAGEEEGDTGPA